MPPVGILPTWAPRLKQSLIRQLYESDAQGMLDIALLDKVGWGLHARCDSFLAAVEAVRGRARCAVCGAVVPHSHQPEEVLHCTACGWELPWKAYFQTIQRKQLSGADPIMALFQEYIDRFPRAREPEQKMLLIDRLIHTFHWNLRFGNTRAAGVNLIEGRYHEVIEFLDQLSRGPHSTVGIPETWSAWREKLNSTAELWKDERLRRT